jgi:hypothetical protein
MPRTCWNGDSDAIAGPDLLQLTPAPTNEHHGCSSSRDTAVDGKPTQHPKGQRCDQGVSAIKGIATVQLPIFRTTTDR